MSTVTRVAIAAPLLALTLAVAPVEASAQRGEGDGYLFRSPSGSLSARFGFARPNAQSDIFKFVTDSLTLNRGDFGGFTFAVDAGLFFGSRFEAVLGVAVAGRRAESHYRDLVDNNDLEIEQSTTFQRVPLTVGLRYYLTPVGRRVGNFAWVPAKFSPYISAGGGGVYYRFHQEGDFVDFVTRDVFPAELESTSWAPTLYGAAGAHFALTPRTALATEFRYDAARAPMDFAFQSFDDIDLSGASVTVGFHLRF